MNVTLTPQLEALVDERVRSGFYEDASEVVREGLRVLFAQPSPTPRLGFVTSTRAELESKLGAGVASLDRGERIPGEAAFKYLQARATARRRHGQILALPRSRR